jgi:hypothetical protein
MVEQQKKILKEIKVTFERLDPILSPLLNQLEPYGRIKISCRMILTQFHVVLKHSHAFQIRQL